MGRAALVVQDTGIGIPAAVLPHVFEPFAQADRSLDRPRGGIGLGLSLVKALVELHGGEVRAFSRGEGRGSEFTVLLPTVNPPISSTVGSVSEPHAVGTPLRVLVVEDNEDAAETLCDLLEIEGHQVEVVFDGLTALEAARRFDPDLVLCDIGLPGMDGYAVAAALRVNPTTRAARLVAVTGYGRDEDRRRSAEAGFEVHLTKPLHAGELQRVMVETMPRQDSNAPTPRP